MSRKTKVFGGKRYYLWDVSFRKGDMTKKANKIRKDGLLARVVILLNKFAPKDKSYELYVHGSIRDLVR
jgi:hypothetical protein